MSIKRLSDLSVKAKSVGGAGPRMDGRWAVLSGGTVTTVVNADGTIDEVRTFTADGTLTVLSPGYAQVFMISGGGGSVSGLIGAGGRVIDGIQALPAGALAVTVGAGGAVDNLGTPSSIGALSTYYSPGSYGGAGATASGMTGVAQAYPSSISGTALTYGQEGRAGATRANRGDGAVASGVGSAGIVIVRVRKSP